MKPPDQTSSFIVIESLSLYLTYMYRRRIVRPMAASLRRGSYLTGNRQPIPEIPLTRTNITYRYTPNLGVDTQILP